MRLQMESCEGETKDEEIVQCNWTLRQVPLLETLIDLICYLYPADQAAIIAGGEGGGWNVNEKKKRQQNEEKYVKRQRRRRSTLTGYHFIPAQAVAETKPSQISQLHLDFLSFCNKDSVFCLLALNPIRAQSGQLSKVELRRPAPNIHVCFTRGARDQMCF